jgi:hypothetical protein
MTAGKIAVVRRLSSQDLGTASNCASVWQHELNLRKWGDGVPAKEVLFRTIELCSNQKLKTPSGQDGVSAFSICNPGHWPPKIGTLKIGVHRIPQVSLEYPVQGALIFGALLFPEPSSMQPAG